MTHNVKHMIANKFLCEMIDRYESPDHEASLAKKIPMRHVEEFQRHFPGAFRYRYRGPSENTETYGFRYIRPRAFCHKACARNFAIYPVNTRINTRWQEYLNWRKDG